MRIGACIVVAALAAVFAAAPAGADGPADTTTAVTTTAPAPTTTAATTTDPAEAVTSTTSTTTAPAPAYAAVEAASLPRGCPSAGAVAIVEPGRQPVVVGAAPVSLGAAAYPASGSVATFDGVTASGSACRPGSVSIQSLSLFGGSVTATSLTATRGAGSVVGLHVDGAPVTLAPGEVVAVGGWGRVVASAHVGMLVAPLALTLLTAHADLPAGTVLLVGFAATPVPAPAATTRTTAAAPKPVHRRRTRARHRRRHVRGRHLPLTVTPPLGLGHYVFPVAGAVPVGDSYGGPRSDIADGWHHGDDIFAPVGTPVLAVADGTLNRVGWERLGGWRLWLRDANGNQFYYAHLAAYTRPALRRERIRRGEVIGFVGRTGDAYSTAPHLHFEIHPRPLLHLHYDGAVDPTRYLDAWPHRIPARVPLPARPRAPKGMPRLEAAVVWRQLLAARHLVHRTARAPHRTLARSAAVAPGRRIGSTVAVPRSSRAVRRTGSTTGRILLGAAIAAVAASAALAGARRRRGEREP
ncbi:MAG TPA: M23 family metallopeptidase [Gaiellaceae bacterium]|nr:M23 family metallopeptidase [Gaiellaceae bacterium]